MPSNQSKINACRDAERLYNLCVQWSVDPDNAEYMLVKLRALYADTIDFLHSNGIGGVLINGVFRCTDNNSSINAR